jgi:hypothetical protein
MSLIIKQTYCQNLRVEGIVLVLFKLLFCSTEKFMNNIISLLDYYSVVRGTKLEKLIYTNNCMGIARSPRYAAIFFVTGNHNKTENEILSTRKLK